MTVSHPLLKFKVGYYQLVTRRVAEFSAQKAAREVHESEQRIAPSALEDATRIDSGVCCM